MRTFHRWCLCSLLITGPASPFELVHRSNVEDPVLLGTQGNADASRCAITDDAALIGFLSGATNLTPSDQNGRVDGFIDNGPALERLSRTQSASDAPMDTEAMAFSSSGQFVVFRLSVDPDVAGSTEWGRIYRLNRNNGNVLMVADYAPPLLGSLPDLAISDDGRYVAFTSSFAQLPGIGTGNHVYRVDMQNGNVVWVDVDLAVAGQTGNAGRISMDGTGNLIAFDSTEPDLVNNDTNGVRDVFVRDISGATTTRVSKRSNGVQGNGISDLADFSDDGNYVLFSSLATNLDAIVADSNGQRDVFRHNLSNGNTRRASLDGSGAEIPEASNDGSISGDGTFVWMISLKDNSRPQLWRKNMINDNLLQITNTQGAVQQVATDLGGTSACFIASERSVDLSPSDQNARDDVYRVTINPGPTAEVVREGQTATAIPAAVMSDDLQLLGSNAAGTRLVVRARGPQIDSASLTTLATRDEYRAYLLDPLAGTFDNPCLNGSGEPSNGSCELAALSGDGRYVFFVSDGSNVHPDVPDAPVNWAQLYRRDLQTGAVLFLSRSTSNGVPPNGANGNLGLATSHDGGRVVFQSFATNLVSGDTNALPDLFLWDQVTGIRRISRHNNGTEANAAPYDRPFMSADGNEIVFAHAASNLVNGDTNGVIDLFRYQVSTDSLTRIAQPGAATSALSLIIDFSPNGEWVLFKSQAPEFTDPTSSDLFLWNRPNNQIGELSLGLPAGQSYVLPAAFIRDDTGLVFGVDSDPSPSVRTIDLRRRYFSSGAPFPILATPATPSSDLLPYAVSDLLVTSDQTAYIEYNWPLSSDDNNRRVDIGQVLSGYGVMAFLTATLDVPESAGTVNIAVERSNGQAFDAAVEALASNGTAIAGSDFSLPAATLLYVWLDSEAGTHTSPLTIIDDTAAEGVETFTLTLANPGTASLGSITSLTVRIIDNDGPLFANGFE